MKTIGVKLDNQLCKRLESYAKGQSMSQSDLIFEALVAFLDKKNRPRTYHSKSKRYEMNSSSLSVIADDGTKMKKR